MRSGIRKTQIPATHRDDHNPADQQKDQNRGYDRSRLCRSSKIQLLSYLPKLRSQFRDGFDIRRMADSLDGSRVALDAATARITELLL
jgi:hypothetical protein